MLTKTIKNGFVIVTDQHGNTGKSRKGQHQALKNYIRNVKGKIADRIAKQAAEMMKAHDHWELFDEDLPYCKQFEDIFECAYTKMVVSRLVKMANDDWELYELIYSGEYISVA